MDTTPAIIFEKVEKNFGALRVLRGISGSIQSGEVVAVIGSSTKWHLPAKSRIALCF